MEKELKHYGVPGMKWGVKKQHETIGKKSSQGFKEASNIANTIARTSGPSKKTRKAISQMSDQELRAKINRMQMEQQYSSLNPSRISRGASHAANVLSVAGSLAAIGGSIAGIALAIKQLKG